MYSIFDVTQLYTVKGECEYLVNVKGKNSSHFSPRTGGMTTELNFILPKIALLKNTP